MEKPLSPEELRMMREMITEYERRQWLFRITKNVAIWVSAIVGAYLIVRGVLLEFPNSK